MSRRRLFEATEEDIREMERRGGVVTCIHCGNTDYYRNPGPWFFYPRFGWFCSIDCWRAHIKQEKLP